MSCSQAIFNDLFLGAMLVKNELNLFAISSLFVMIELPSLKNSGNDVFLLVQFNISLIVFQIPRISSLNLLKIV